MCLTSWSAPFSAERLPVDRRANFQMRQAAKIHPQIEEPGMVRRSVAWSWDAHPSARGGSAFPFPRQRSLLRDAALPEERIYFAGEQCSLHHAWIQGALETAMVAVRDMLARDVYRIANTLNRPAAPNAQDKERRTRRDADQSRYNPTYLKRRKHARPFGAVQRLVGRLARAKRSLAYGVASTGAYVNGAQPPECRRAPVRRDR
ncbi:MAG: FAD-dependent oxidoreductase [Gemmatimonadetes bacterium]|nr:FAD-dependent oxidoreductase [Gemmatimonadota bacterium]